MSSPLALLALAAIVAGGLFMSGAKTEPTTLIREPEKPAPPSLPATRPQQQQPQPKLSDMNPPFIGNWPTGAWYLS